MSTAIRSLWAGCLAGLLFVTDARLVAKGGESGGARMEAAALSLDGNDVIQTHASNAAPPLVAPAPPSPEQSLADSTSVTYRSYAPVPGANSRPGSYYYYDPGSCRWYYAVPVESPGAALGAAAPAQTALGAPVVGADSRTYRSYSPNPDGSAPYLYYYPGTYRYPSSSGHSWGTRR